jgi:hypothetical protein
MADITITPASVLPPASGKFTDGVVGETVTAGMLLYLKDADSLWYKADCLTLEKAGGTDINKLKWAMAGATAGQPCPLLTVGQEITLGAVLSQGRVYALSATATSGKMCPIADLVNTNILVVLGYAKTSSVFVFSPIKPGIALA